MIKTTVAALLASMAICPSLGFAADLRPDDEAPLPRGSSETYIVTLTANGQFQPTFPGSDKLTGMVYPAISIRRADEPPRFAAPDDGFSFSFLDSTKLRIGFVGRYDSGRYLDDDRRLFGLHKVPWDVELGGFIEYWPVSWVRARIELRHGTRDGIGFVGNAGIDFVRRLDRFTFSLGPRMTFADTEYNREYFGVNLLEAALNGRVTPYRPQGGINSFGALGAVTYQWNDTWATTGYVGYNRLVSNAADSPIVRRIGSENQFTVGASISYSFAWNPPFKFLP
jgi:outer membrane scaffolding protein for murein synthesis (MipA/OmpV family)